MKNIISLSIIVFLILLFGNSCKEKIDKPCDKKFKVIGYKSWFAIDLNKDNYYNGLTQPDSTDTIGYNSLNIFIKADIETLEKNKICEPNIKLQGKVKHIDIKSNNIYNANYQSDVSLNSMFSLIFADENYKVSEQPIKVDSFNSDIQSNKLSYDLFFNEPPDSIRIHSFTIQINIDDSIYVIHTKPITVKP